MGPIGEEESAGFFLCRFATEFWQKLFSAYNYVSFICLQWILENPNDGTN